MEDVVAVRVTFVGGGVRFFMTWGRLFDPVDPAQLCATIRQQVSARSAGGEVDDVSVCETLQEAREAPYFYEGLLHFAWERPAYGEGYERWRAAKASAIRGGKDVYDLG
jgi:hypothetical protein